MAQRDWAEKDYYKILGVSKTASKDEIKKAYRKLAQKHHPDANTGDKDAEARFKEISEAHAILSNDEKRAEYDQIRQFIESGGRRFYNAPGGGGNVRVNIGDLFGDPGAAGADTIFEDLLGGFGFRPRGPQRGQDLETETTLGFEDAANGVTVSLPEGGKAKIPPGVGDGARIKVPGRGAPGPNGGPPGDLYVRVRVEPHAVFTRARSGDLVVELPVTFTEAALGAKVEVPTLDGSVTVKIPAGTPNGKTLRVRGRGGPSQRGSDRDLLVRVMVQVPEKLTRREKQLLEEFAEVHDESPRRHLEDHIKSAPGSVAS
ncbi:MAG TPA: DnaJ C-terminal domain-containing protein [Actinomycetota bacterium]|nr:DnaJ C-terminal domain-containing protein [Actinomycetota bacterium]